jgi:nitrate reductase NapE component
MIDQSEDAGSKQRGFRRSTLILVALLFAIPIIALAVMAYDVLGFDVVPEGCVVSIETGGQFYIVRDGELPPGASITFHIMLEVPAKRRRWLAAGDTVKVIDAGDSSFARVQVLSGGVKGERGWVDQDLLLPSREQLFPQKIVTFLMFPLVAVGLILVLKLLIWIMKDPNAIYAKKTGLTCQTPADLVR